MRRSLQHLLSLLLLLPFVLLTADSSYAGGPLGATGTTPRRYASTSFPLRYSLDQGTLGSFSNATASSIANYAFAQWAAVKSATVRFTNAGYLSHDVTSAADPLISGSTQWSDGINPIVFDNDGSITDAKLGAGAHTSVIGFAGSAYSGNTYVEGYAIINGSLSGSGTSTDVDRYEAVLTHELGHFLGLGHSQVSMHSDFCTMYPVIEKTSQKYLSPDDTTAIANLYPATGFAALNGNITGTVRTPAGVNLSGVNVIAEDAVTGVAYSTVVDYYSGGKSGFDSPPAASGTYTFTGLHPGAYNIRIEPMNASFSGGSSVASYYTPINTSVAREWWNDGSESGDMLTDNVNQHTTVTVTAALTTSGINFVSNESSTLTNLVYHNGTPYYIWQLPQGTIVKYAIRCTAPAKGGLVEVQFRLDPSSVLPSNGTMTISVHQNAAGSLAGIPGAVLGSVTIPYTELATDQYNEVYLRGLGSAVNFDSNATFHISFSTNGVGQPVFYTDNGSPSQNRTSYQTSDGTWRNFPDGGYAAGYNLIASAIFTKTPVAAPVVTVPQVSLAPTSLNFGSVNIRTTLDQNIRLTNTGNGALNVTGTSVLGIDSLDYAIVTGGGAFSLAPGAYHDFTIRFQPCNTAGPEGPTRSAKLMIASNAGTSPNYVPLVGTAVVPSPVAVVPVVKLGTVRPGSNTTWVNGIVYNAGLDTLRTTSVNILGMGNDSTTIRIMTPAGAVPVPPDSTYRISIQFSPSTRQNYTATLRMLHDGLPAFTDIPISGNAAAGLLAVDSQLTMNSIGTSGYTDSTLLLQNNGNATLLIKGITITGMKDSLQGPFFQILQQLPIEIPEGGSLRLPVHFNPIAGSGDYLGTLVLQTDSYPDSLQTIIIHATSVSAAVAEGSPSSFGITIAPNPAVNAATLSYLARHAGTTLTLYDVTGKQVLSRKLSNSSGMETLDLSALPSGEYYAELRATNELYSAKLVIGK